MTFLKIHSIDRQGSKKLQRDPQTININRQCRLRRIENRRGSHRDERKDPKRTIWPTEKRWPTHGRLNGGAGKGQNKQNERNDEENGLSVPEQVSWKGQT